MTMPTLGAVLDGEANANLDHAENAFTKGRPLRLGVLGCGAITAKNVASIAEVDCVVVSAVASRTLEKAQKFAEENHVQHAFGNYDELLASGTVDAIYLPIPTALRIDWVKKIAAKKLHLLCEKPCASNVGELVEMLKVCRENNVHFMDGVMFMHHDRMIELSKLISEGAFGKSGATHVTSNFCFGAPEDFFSCGHIRDQPNMEPLGALGDLGWYTTRLALMAFDWKLPEFATGIVSTWHNGVPMDVVGSLFWAKENAFEGNEEVQLCRTTSFHISFLHSSQQHAQISGHDGSAIMDFFVIPQNNDESSFRIEQDIVWHEQKEGTNIQVKESTRKFGRCRQEAKMWEHFAKQVSLFKEGKYDVSFWPKIALATQLCIDAVLKSAQSKSVLTAVDPQGIFQNIR